VGYSKPSTISNRYRAQQSASYFFFYSMRRARVRRNKKEGTRPAGGSRRLFIPSHFTSNKTLFPSKLKRQNRTSLRVPEDGENASSQLSYRTPQIKSREKMVTYAKPRRFV